MGGGGGLCWVTGVMQQEQEEADHTYSCNLRRVQARLCTDPLSPLDRRSAFEAELKEIRSRAVCQASTLSLREAQGGAHAGAT